MAMHLFLTRAAMGLVMLWVAVAVGGLAAERAAAQCTPTVELLAPDRAAGDVFGAAVAISGDTAVVGAFHHADTAISSMGAAYVFVRNGAAWTQQAELLPNPGELGGFGSSVAINGNTILVGTSTTGAAYVFNRSGTAWTQQARLTQPGEQIGTGVALGGVGASRLVAVIGAQFSTVNGLSDAGAAYIYTFNTLQVGSTWTQVARLTAADPHTQAFFGWKVAISGGIAGATVAIGAPFDTNANGTSAGAGYFFTSNNVGSGWTQQAKVLANVGHAGDELGLGVAVNGDSAVFTTNTQDFLYLFTRSGTGWTNTQTIPGLGNTFPASPRLIGDTMVSGENSLDINDRGRINVLTRPSGSGTAGVWTHRAVLTAAASEVIYAVNDGVTADFSGPYIIMGQPSHHGTPALTYSGAAYIFDTTTLCPADFDCSGTLAVADIFAFLSAWFAGTPAADFDGDSVLAIADIFAFLNTWFAGC